jgi:crotonobetainyl-CoA:carnitine CoA-transferase CaiB-like acyl-CoA transferase
MATMLLADHGAEVTALEPPGGRSFDPYPGGRAVWMRGKSSVTADTATAEGREVIAGLVGGFDILVDDGDLDELAGLLEGEMAAGLIRASITGYGNVARHGGRPAVDALVAARTGMHWDQRGVYGGLPAWIAGVPKAGFGPPADSSQMAPPGAEQTGHREGPIFLALPWPSIGAALLTVTGISAAVLAREVGGPGQYVTTSLMAGGLLCGTPTWQRVPDPEARGYRLPYFDRRHPKGLFRCSDGNWVHHWAPIDHAWVRAAASGGSLHIPADGEAGRLPRPADYDGNLAAEVADHEETAAAFARYPAADWVDLFARANRPCQPVRPPEAGLQDDVCLEDGCVVEVDDPTLGKLRQVGRVYTLSAAPIDAPAPAPAPGSTKAVPAKERAARGPGRPAPAHAMAGPYGAQFLGDLGASVIKIHNPSERHGPVSSPTVGCHRGKRSLALDLKDRRGTEILHRLAASTDVVHHNLRIGVAERLRADDATLRAINPRLIYCHTRGFEASGPRSLLPGNDQMGQALAGTWWELGGVADGGAPSWHPSALGDFGNGVVSAIAVIQALYQRERTGLGQRVGTSILNVGLLYNSYTWAGPDGQGPPRPRLDAAQLGLGPFYRLYRAADGWLCLAATTEAQVAALEGVIGAELAQVPPGRAAETLEKAFVGTATGEWLGILDAAGVPCEESSPAWIREMWDDPDALGAGLVVGYPHPTLGRVEQAGHLVALSATPGRIEHPSPLVGQHSREILAEAGLLSGDVDALIEAGVVHQSEV